MLGEKEKLKVMQSMETKLIRRPVDAAAKWWSNEQRQQTKTQKGQSWMKQRLFLISQQCIDGEMHDAMHGQVRAAKMRTKDSYKSF